MPAAPLSMVDTSRLPITPEQAAAINPTLSVPVGLALPDPTGKPFNLLPREISAKAAERRQRRVLVIAGVALVVVLALLSVWRVLQVNHEQSAVNQLNANINTLTNVDIPKYNQAVALKNQVLAQQAALRPLVTSEVDWLTVLNEVSLYLPSTAVFAGIQMQATPGTASTPIVATASTSVTVASLSDVTSWGQTFSQCPILVSVNPSGTFAPAANGSVTFGASMSINSRALNQAPGPLSEVIP
jgi:hypothetical protein